MNYDYTATDTEHFVDQEHKMMNEQNHEWNQNGDNGKGDAINRNFIAYFLYDDHRFIKGIIDCWEFNTETNKYKGCRYPTCDRTDLSRDHVLHTVLAKKLYQNRFNLHPNGLKHFIRHIPWKISDKFKLTPTLWFYFRAITNIKWAIPLYYICEFVEMSLATLWNNFISTIAVLPEELDQNKYSELKQMNAIPDLTSFQIMCKNLLYPQYTILQLAWKLYFLKDNWFKRQLVRMISSLVPKHNYVIQLLLQTDQQPTREQVYSYRAMKGGRWSTYLNGMTSRDLNVIEDRWPDKAEVLLRANVIDVDLVRKLYDEMESSK